MRLKMIFSMLFVLMMVGCEEQSIVDPTTQESPAIFEKKKDSIIIQNNNDGMHRRNLEYDSRENGNLVVDPNYYIQNEFKRGEVVYYKTPVIDKSKYPNLNPSEQNISRVIALSGEVVEIKKGQIYVDGKKLDAFYGKVSSWGMDEAEYFKNVNQPGSAVCNETCQKNMKEYFNMDMRELKVPDNHLFVLGDTAWRSIDSLTYGALPINNVIGKVEGYEKK